VVLVIPGSRIRRIYYRLLDRLEQHVIYWPLPAPAILRVSEESREVELKFSKLEYEETFGDRNIHIDYCRDSICLGTSGYDISLSHFASLMTDHVFTICNTFPWMSFGLRTIWSVVEIFGPDTSRSGVQPHTEYRQDPFIQQGCQASTLGVRERSSRKVFSAIDSNSAAIRISHFRSRKPREILLASEWQFARLSFPRDPVEETVID
jgi:hypothetical protein